MHGNRKKSKDITRRVDGAEVASVWESLNPLLKNVFEQVAVWLKETKSRKQVLCLFCISNAAEIIFSYGLEAEKLLNSEIEKVLEEHFGVENAKHARIGVQDFVFLIDYEGPFTLQQSIENSIQKVQSYCIAFGDSPIYVQFYAGYSLINKTDNIADKFSECLISLSEVRNREGVKHLNFFDIGESQERLKNEVKMAATIKNAIENNKLAVAFQHIVCSKTGKVKSYEVLLRLIAPNGELISAGKYIKVAEDFGFITEIDIYVLKTAVDELQKADNLCLNINVSAKSISSGKWLKQAQEHLKDPDIAKRLIVEITETSYHHDVNQLVDFVESVQSLGCEIAIDDFGTGYTSFAQLKMINADILKIDGIFISDILDNPDSRLFIKTMVDFSKAFGLKTVAEFVENGEIAKLLIEMGIDYLQGHYFGKELTHRPWIKKDSIN